MDFSQTDSQVLVAAIALVAIISFFLSPRVTTADGFFKGTSEKGIAPGLWTLVLSQVTTWIFARSLMNAAILGYYYGYIGAVAYAAYYLSFLTGGAIVDSLRFKHGAHNVQSFLKDHYGSLGTWTYNFVVGVRLLSEVFANLLVVGIIFGVAGTQSYIIAVMGVAVLTLIYSMMGGLRASLKTDVFQTLLLYIGLGALLALTINQSGFDFNAVLASSPDMTSPGWVLLVVALLQIWSYPLHDPVMMDRGFLADRSTTRWSFFHAAWISIIGIMIFGLIGTYAGLSKADGENMVATLTRLLGDPTMMLFNLALVVSAVSTLDSTFSSASKLVVKDMRLMKETVNNGRIVMALFLIGGLAFLFTGSKDLFAAVAVSGTASMFLAPVVFFNIWGGQRTASWAYALTFLFAIGGGALYMLEAGAYASVMKQWFGVPSLIESLFGVSHKYSKLLIICGVIMTVGTISFMLGRVREDQSAPVPANA